MGKKSNSIWFRWSCNFQSRGWNRAPIDRMANTNLEPGNSSFEELISSVKYGVYMKAISRDPSMIIGINFNLAVSMVD